MWRLYKRFLRLQKKNNYFFGFVDFAKTNCISKETMYPSKHEIKHKVVPNYSEKVRNQQFQKLPNNNKLEQ